MRAAVGAAFVGKVRGNQESRNRAPGCRDACSRIQRVTLNEPDLPVGDVTSRTAWMRTQSSGPAVPSSNQHPYILQDSRPR